MASTAQRKSHRENFRATNLRLDMEAADLLDQHAKGPKAHGEFVSNLIVDFHRRQGFKDFFEQESRRQLKRFVKEIQAAKACE